jgi:hypothetical protein
MDRTACTEPKCLYGTAKPLLPLWAVRPVQSLSACTVELYLYSSYGSYGLYRALVPVQGRPLYLTFICLRWSYISYDFGISRTASRGPHRIRDVTPGTLTATDTCIGYHVTRFDASRKVILHTRYVSTCVCASDGSGRENNDMNKSNPLWHMLL